MAQFLIFFYCFFPPFLLPMKKSALQFFLSARLGAKKVSSIQAWLILLHFFVISMNGAWYNVFWLWSKNVGGKCSLKKMIRVWLVFFPFCLKMHLLRHVRVVPLDTHFIFFWKFTSFWELGSGLDLIRHTYMYEFQDIFINVHIVRKFNLREDIYIVYTVYFV